MARMVFVLCWVTLACDDTESQQARPLRLATSFSLDKSGLFAALTPKFRARTGLRVEPFFVGTGAALEMGRASRADVVWVHSRPMEDTFVSEGYGMNRLDVMYSEYVLVGPADDPAGIRGKTSVIEALAQLAQQQAPFVSRGDRSGNHAREKDLWLIAGIQPEGDWYVRAEAGMLATLKRADVERAYALSDRPTHLVNRATLDLEVLVSGDSRLHNPYGIIAVNPTKVPSVDYASAISYIDFVTSVIGQAVIAEVGRARYGESLFKPMAQSDPAP